MDKTKANPTAKEAKPAVIKRLPKAEVEIDLTFAWEEVKTTYSEVVEKSAKLVQIDGFRLGKAPKKLAEDKLDKSKVYSEVIQILLAKHYERVLKENDLKPITSPRISLVSAKENEPWVLKILICEKPKVALGNYKDEVTKINSAKKIWVPGKDKAAPTPGEAKRAKEENVQKILAWLEENIKVEVSDLLIEEEVNRRLAQLVDQTQKIGLSVEQYLSSSGKTAQDIKNEYQQEARRLWQIELVLNEIAENLNIVVEPKEIDDLIQKTPNEKERLALGEQKYFLASVLRRQKALDFLANL